MEQTNVLFTKPKKAIGLDIGSHSVKAIQMSRSGGRLCVDEAGYALVDRAMVVNDPIGAHAMAVREAMQAMSAATSLVVGALPGQTVVIRYPRIPDTAPNEMNAVVQREASQNIPYDLSEVFLDWSLLDVLTEGDKRQLKVLLVAAKHEVIESRVEIASAAEVQYGVLSVDSLALADAAEACGMFRQGETVALVNIGLTSASIHFVKDGKSNFIRDVNWGARELMNAIVKERRVDQVEAERVLQNEAAQEAQRAVERQAAPPPPPPEVSGASLLDPLDEEMGFGGDPFGEAPATAAPASVETRSLRDVLSGALTRMVSEIRRSFDYYEHQLYERPVDRLILSGGAAMLPLLGETLLEELGVETVEIADPGGCNLIMGDARAVQPLREHSPQFMVAMGLAARGMAEL
jgi:type IV pilus assembly protein PilM